MRDMVIYGLYISVSNNNIHIEDSYTVDDPLKMSLILTDLKAGVSDIETPFDHRSIESMISEWVSHNNCYKLGLWRGRVKDVDINYPQPWYMPMIYWLTSRIVL